MATTSFAVPAATSIHLSKTYDVSPAQRWTGIAMSAIAVLFLLFDSVIKLVRLTPVVEGTVQLGYPAHAIVPIGVILLICVIVHVVPRTAILGAVLLTGYFGGAIATHVRVDNPLLTHVLFPIYVAVLIWGGLYLRDPRLRHVLRSAK